MLMGKANYCVRLLHHGLDHLSVDFTPMASFLIPFRAVGPSFKCVSCKHVRLLERFYPLPSRWISESLGNSSLSDFRNQEAIKLASGYVRRARSTCLGGILALFPLS